MFGLGKMNIDESSELPFGIMDSMDLFDNDWQRAGATLILIAARGVATKIVTFGAKELSRR